MQTQKNLLALGLTSVGMIASASPTYAAPRAVNDVKEVSITAEESATRIMIKGSQSFTPEVKSLGKTGVTTITLPGVWQAGRAGTKSIQKNGVAFVRFGQYSMRPSQQVRIVANHSSRLRKNLRYELIPSENQTQWEVVIHGPGSVSTELPHTEIQAVNLGSIAAVAPTGMPRFAMALSAEKDPIPGHSVHTQRTPVSVDTRALTAAATRVASNGTFAPLSTAGFASYSLLRAPQLSLASVLTMAPLKRPMVSTVASAASLKPYPSRTSEPSTTRVLPPLERPLTVTEALASPVTLADLTQKQAKKAVVIPVSPPKIAAPKIAAPKVADLKVTPVETKPAPVEPSPALAEPTPTPTPAPVAVAQENPLDRIVSLDIVNSELADVLKLIQVQAKVNVVSGQSVIGKKATLSLQKVMLRDALDWITRLSGVAYTLEGNSTILVGTGQEIALLKRTNQTQEALSANIPFFYADAESLKAALSSAFPNVTLHVIKASEESKKTDDNSKQGVPPGDGASFKATTGTSAGGGAISALATIKPRGGSLYVVGTRSIIDELRRTIEDMEHGLVEIAQRDADRKAEQMRGYINDVYEVKYVDPTQAARLVLESVPNVIIRPGPSQRFIASPVGLGGALGQIGGGAGDNMQSGGGQGGGQGQGGQGGQGQVQGQGQGGGSNLIESRVLMVTGKAGDVLRAKEMLAQLDVKVPQFIYEARLVEVNKDNVNQLGLKYDLGRAVQIGENDNGGNGSVINSIGGGRKLNGGAIFRTPYSVASQIDALATVGKANILARPTLSALDGNPAITFIGDQVPYVISQSIGANGGLNIVTGVASAGIRLQVSGRSNGDGTMTIYVHPEISTITQFVGTLPQISTRFVDTTIRVKNGETIAIGGLVQKQDIDNMRKVPGLGDLPILGQLFRSSDKRTKESEVLIFITCSLSKD